MQPVCGKCGPKLAAARTHRRPSHPLTVTDQSLPQELSRAGDKPVLVDCWAPWCPPCRAIASGHGPARRRVRGRYVVAKLNVDENPGTANRFHIDGIPPC
jgi:thioredoxin-like negative regulator of GroEL